MALTNKQYDALMRGYDRRQYRNYRTQCAHTDEIYRKIPRIREIDETISSCSVRQAEKLFDREANALSDLKAELDALRLEKQSLLREAGYPSDYLEMTYTCQDCQDTGYIGLKKCHCFRSEEIRLLYSSSHLNAVLEKENFSTLSYEVYDEEQRANMPRIIKTCQEFIHNFEKSSDNLLFYGPVGTGKTFLSNCIAKELLDSGHSVIYFTSFQLFELFSRTGQKFDDRENFRQCYETLLESDLLIVDDIGTELPNTFTVSKLFQILNERSLLSRSTIISTNLSLQQFRDVYSERIFSRVSNSYKLLKFTGSDIRISRKLHGG